jgi:probable AcnD-accessory protein PrpF
VQPARTLKIPAIYMRGGTSKGVFFKTADLPAPGAARDRLLLRVLGSPDPYGKQMDGMGGATSSTSKAVLLSRSSRPDCDIDYLFGQVSVDKSIVDWSGTCGNLAAAVGPFAIEEGLVSAPENGTAVVRVWQVGLRRKILVHVPVSDGAVVEDGSFELDGVAFPGAKLRLDFIDPSGSEHGGGKLFPTGKLVDRLRVPGHGEYEVTMIDAGMPAIFMRAEALGLSGTELQPDVNARPELLARCEAIRAHGAVAMGVAPTIEAATERFPHAPKLAFVAPPRGYKASSGKAVAESDIDLLVRIISMGMLHHAMTGTGGVAVAAAASIPGTLVHALIGDLKDHAIRIGHPSGTLEAAAEARSDNGTWSIAQVSMYRTARRIMEGYVRVPATVLD